MYKRATGDVVASKEADTEGRSSTENLHLHEDQGQIRYIRNIEISLTMLYRDVPGEQGFLSGRLFLRYAGAFRYTLRLHSSPFLTDTYYASYRLEGEFFGPWQRAKSEKIQRTERQYPMGETMDRLWLVLLQELHLQGGESENKNRHVTDT